jgi:hypothetical protein
VHAVALARALIVRAGLSRDQPDSVSIFGSADYERMMILMAGKEERETERELVKTCKKKHEKGQKSRKTKVSLKNHAKKWYEMRWC